MSSSGRLFDLDAIEVEQPAGSAPDRADGRSTVVAAGERVVRVVPDMPGLDRALDYICPRRWAETITVGSIVVIDVVARRVDGWVVDLDVEPPAGKALRPIERVASVGPPEAIVDLARWAADRWCGRLAPVLKAASPDRRVATRPAARPGSPADRGRGTSGDALARLALDQPGVTLVRVGPASDRLRFARAAAAAGDALILTPTVFEARRVSAQLAADGHRVHLQPRAWPSGFSGGVVVGSRSAVWAPLAAPAAVVVLEEHETSYQEERSPTWNARDVAIERAYRAGVPCVLVTATPSPEAWVAADRVLTESRGPMRRAWPVVEVVDQRATQPGRGGLFPSLTVERMRSADRVVAVLNRKGRAVMLACASCGEVVRTDDGDHLMNEIDGELVAPLTGERRPLICALCGGTTLRRIRLGVTRAAEELAVLLRRPVAEVTAGTDRSTIPADAVLLGTEAVLHRGVGADVVVFLDFDQELLANRFRAAEQAMALIGRAARLTGGRDRDTDSPGRLIIQTHHPEHRVVRAAAAADVGPFIEAEIDLRKTAGFPPFAALARLSGPGAEELAASIGPGNRAVGPDGPDNRAVGPGGSVSVLGPGPDGDFLVRAADHETLSAVMAAVDRPRARVRIEVDPIGI